MEKIVSSEAFSPIKIVNRNKFEARALYSTYLVFVTIPPCRSRESRHFRQFDSPYQIILMPEFKFGGDG